MKAILQLRELATADGFVLHDARERVTLEEPFNVWTPPRETFSHAVALVRSGGFRRQATGKDYFVDATGGYAHPPGVEERYTNVAAGVSTLTLIRVPPGLYHELVEGTEAPVGRRLVTSAAFDLSHRALLAACLRGTDSFEVSERLITLLRALPGRTERPADTGRPTTRREHLSLVARAKEVLNHGQLAIGLRELADLVGSSPHHLSRVFHRETGSTLTAYRNEVRVRAVLESLAEGADNLAELAARHGFADHAHLTRTVRRHTARSPSALRSELSEPELSEPELSKQVQAPGAPSRAGSAYEHGGRAQRGLHENAARP